MSNKLGKFHSSIPLKFARQPRSVPEVDRWRATEFRQFLLYTGPPALSGVLTDVVYNHFMLLSVAITLLESSKLCSAHEDYAHSLLRLATCMVSILWCMTSMD